MSGRESFTGRARRKQTPWTVRFADVASRVIITIGGIGTIVAVLLVLVFLASVVIPLFKSATLTNETAFPTPWAENEPLHVAVDEHQTIGWALYPDGQLLVFRASDGAQVDRQQLFSGVRLTAASVAVGEDNVSLGFEDGTVRVGRIGFETSFCEKRDMPEELKDLPVGDQATLEKGVVQRTPIGQFRTQRVMANLKPPTPVAEAPIALIDHFLPNSEEAGSGLASEEYHVFTLTGSGKLLYSLLSEKEDFLSAETKIEAETSELPYEPRDKTPSYLLVSAQASSLVLIWKDGLLRRYDTWTPEEGTLAEEVELLSESEAEVSACQYILGRETLACGDTEGGLRAWFLVREEKEEESKLAAAIAAAEEAENEAEAANVDGHSKNTFRLEMVHDLPQQDSRVTCLGSSKRSRMLAAGYDSGQVVLYHVTTDQEVIAAKASTNEPIRNVLLMPKDNGLLATAGQETYRWDFAAGHPEATAASLFLPVWYEGYSEPIQRWQSSFADVGPEMKLGLYPLIFGTLKATLYSMLFGAPLALLAAIYTSEFVSPRLRTKIKPTIEIMAALPSVVLGFLAALVFAPMVERFVPSLMASFVTIPVALLFGSYLWQLIPRRAELVLSRYGLRLAGILLVLILAVVVAAMMGPVLEQWFFAGDVMRWLDGQVGNGIAAWIMLLLPLCGFATWCVVGSHANTWLRQNCARMSHWSFGLVNMAKFLLAIAVTFAVAYGFAVVFNAFGWDLRGTLIDTYVQRNALVVGFVMGFAIIPIIYTIAEDALSTVPKHLRSASLGAGATPWQTAVRIVIPTAMSGLFSALMIGLGRAVGETMIVLMAAGNTPVMDLNVFNGFRTLSANIAVELPEAVRNSTHYRTLFLAALVLFILTFIVNTVAEIVRLRFRRRAYQL